VKYILDYGLGLRNLDPRNLSGVPRIIHSATLLYINDYFYCPGQILYDSRLLKCHRVREKFPSFVTLRLKSSNLIFQVPAKIISLLTEDGLLCWSFEIFAQISDLQISEGMRI
jgi:hypothetical protein